MKHEYAVIVYNIFKSFKNRNVNVEEVTSAIESYLLQSGSVEIRKSGQEITLEILKNYVIKYSSWDEYELLQTVVKCCGKKEEQEILDEYEKGPLEES